MLNKVSIIVPVYNVEKYLSKCMESLLGQIYRNIEVILVDDGSTDNSGRLCDEYSVKDIRCKVFHKTNGGLPEARNYGIKQATGNFIMFVDSDDWIDENYISICMEEFGNISVECVITPYIREFGNRSCKTYTLGTEKLTFIGQEVKSRIHRRLFGLTAENIHNPVSLDELNTAWGKLYRRSFIEGIEFTSVEIIGSSEDVWFNIQLFDRFKKVVYNPKVFYHYNKINNSSIVHSYRSNLIETKRNFHKFMKNYIEKHNLGKDYCEALYNRCALTNLEFVRNIMNSKFSFSKKRKLITSLLKERESENCYKEFPFSNLPIKWRIYHYMCCYKFTTIVLLMTWIAERLKKYLR